MQAFRDVIESKKLDRVLNLPPELRDTEVEIIVLPTGKKKKKGTKLSQNWAGALKDQRNKYTSLELQKKALDWRGD
jgi:hypothetical protein